MARLCLLLACAGWAATSVSNIQLYTPQGAKLLNDERVRVTFTYTTDEAAGVIIYPLPCSKGSRTPWSTYTASRVYAVGTDTADLRFGIQTIDTLVDTLLIQILKTDNKTVLHETYHPVRYRFSPHLIDSVVFTPPYPANMPPGARVDVAFKFGTTHAGLTKIFTTPLAKGKPVFASYGGVENYYGPRGSGSAYFTVGNNTVVDSVLFEFRSAGADTSLAKIYRAVRYEYGRPLAVFPPVHPRADEGSTEAFDARGKEVEPQGSAPRRKPQSPRFPRP